jgi:hypothetical protein
LEPYIVIAGVVVVILFGVGLLCDYRGKALLTPDEKLRLASTKRKQSVAGALLGGSVPLAVALLPSKLGWLAVPPLWFLYMVATYFIRSSAKPPRAYLVEFNKASVLLLLALCTFSATAYFEQKEYEAERQRKLCAAHAAQQPVAEGPSPNPSIERTCPGKPGHASHVKR